jgi:hypothetical protein
MRTIKELCAENRGLIKTRTPENIKKIQENNKIIKDRVIETDRKRVNCLSGNYKSSIKLLFDEMG